MALVVAIAIGVIAGDEIVMLYPIPNVYRIYCNIICLKPGW